MKFSKFYLSCLSSVALAVSMTFFSPSARADDQQRYVFSVSKGDLSSVLTQIARAGQVTVSVPAELVANKSAGPIRGNTTLRAAFAEALAGTGLSIEAAADGSYTVRSASPSSSGTRGAQLEGDIDAIDVTDVRGIYNDQGFKAGTTGSMLPIGGGADIKDVPLAISAVTQDVLRSQQDSNPIQAARNVPGVALTNGGKGLNIRGFNNLGEGSKSRVQIDGQSVTGITLPPELVDRVEVLKGPTSILNGISADGGSVNLATKQADGEERKEFGARFGTHQSKTLSADIGGLFPGSDEFSYRFVASGTHQNEFDREKANLRNFAISPSVAWEDDTFSLSAGLTYLNGFNPDDEYYFIPYTGPGSTFGTPVKVNPNKLDASNRFGDDRQMFRFESKQAVELGEAIGFDWKLENRFQYTRRDSKRLTLNPFSSSFSPGVSPVFPFGANYSEDKDRDLSDRISLTAKYEADSFTNTLTTGYEYILEKSTSSRNDGNENVDVDFSTPIPSVSTIDRTLSNAISFDVPRHGVFLINKLDTLEDRLHVLGSVRKDFWKQNVNFQDFVSPLPEPFTTVKNDAVSWTAGAVYDLSDWVSVYANASHGVSPSQASDVILPPEEKDLKEVGFRFSLFDDALDLTASVYDLRRKNVTYPTGTGDYVVVDSQRSRGVELGLQGEITTNLQTTLALSYVDATFSNFQSTSPTASFANVGFGIPKFTGSLWTTYRFDETTILEGTTIGFGLRGNAKSDMIVHDNPRNIPGYIVADASIGYEKDNWSVNLKVNNIFDRFAFSPSNANSVLVAEPGRNFVLEARAKF